MRASASTTSAQRAPSTDRAAGAPPVRTASVPRKPGPPRTIRTEYVAGLASVGGLPLRTATRSANASGEPHWSGASKASVSSFALANAGDPHAVIAPQIAHAVARERGIASLNHKGRARITPLCAPVISARPCR